MAVECARALERMSGADSSRELWQKRSIAGRDCVGGEGAQFQIDQTTPVGLGKSLDHGWLAEERQIRVPVTHSSTEYPSHIRVPVNFPVLNV